MAFATLIVTSSELSLSRGGLLKPQPTPKTSLYAGNPPDNQQGSQTPSETIREASFQLKEIVQATPKESSSGKYQPPGDKLDAYLASLMGWFSNNY